MAILTEAMIQKAITEAVKAAVTKISNDLLWKIKRAEMRAKTIDNIIEGVIPRVYSGYVRDQMKGRIRKDLRKIHVI